MSLRKLKNQAFIGFCVLSALFGLVVLSSVLYSLVGKGIAGMGLPIFTELTPGPGSHGGLKNAIVGSLILTTLGIVIATPLGILAGTWLSESNKSSRAAEMLRFLNGMLMSAPSILIGLFVYKMVVVTTGSFSGWAGATALAILALPIIVSTTEEMLRLVPTTLKEAGSGLGAPRWQVITKLCYRAAGPGIITGVLLAMARITGETAPLLFTALNSNYMTTDMSQPMANLPVTIYQYAMSPYQSWNELAWAGALLIATFILMINILATVLPRWLKARKATK
ncbi:phosphate ABC transporter permease PstA [Endozoicomonas sp. SCSIO W0465]|uniref:phosphate ABC transporter permease PstA n=1 Tax=Endozoicomonas sp. SCSIO W0465 TaxID=2918516 RepID=UPI002075ECC3|nr:phosphate ABC transporter permease PstA [Endozoicomonas sp. SCSIO W0465]USE34002.1 phosphate ABC transporter permease PstA [Endozoicomonas sp. SCSIO W0465]